tara:strand:- start:440 stop:766 length:327 start_codon:yes stop_codon:yes gene_type:complete
MPVTESLYDADSNESTRFQPLMIASSGGSGHKSAIEGIISFLQKEYEKVIILPQYHPTEHKVLSRSEDRGSQGQIEAGLKWLHEMGGALRYSERNSKTLFLSSLTNTC